MLKVFNFSVESIGILSISAHSEEEARDILNAYIEKRSLN
jgi:hypothetical protein